VSLGGFTPVAGGGSRGPRCHGNTFNFRNHDATGANAATGIASGTHPLRRRNRWPLTSGPRTAEIAPDLTRQHVPSLSLHTPIGDLSVAEADGAIVAVEWGWGRDQDETALLRRAREQLHAWFDTALTEFDLPLAPEGSVYRQAVWRALLAIPYGGIRTYLDIAHAAGGSPRSVGGANGANPIPIIIPCHRVVATTGIGGYSGGDGLPTKRALLALENPYWETAAWGKPRADHRQASLI
jgi:methylated-DNA-[protein]-cysteine S-methyltransferase